MTSSQLRKRLLVGYFGLTWIAIGLTWAFAFDVSSDPSMNLSWVLVWWSVFTVFWAFAGFVAFGGLEASEDERLAELETRVEELEMRLREKGR